MAIYGYLRPSPYQCPEKNGWLERVVIGREKEMQFSREMIFDYQGVVLLSGADK
ncbi:MAG: hypothetical protein JRI56_10505 [Deltaproteobacteria bacterium]|nr:hypothetical protein [Deltaproteobacteria bacterium]